MILKGLWVAGLKNEKLLLQQINTLQHSDLLYKDSKKVLLRWILNYM